MPTSQPDVMARFLLEAPPEWDNLAKFLGRMQWEVRSTQQFYGGGVDARPRTIISRSRIYFDARVGGMKLDTTGISDEMPTGGPLVGTDPEFETVLAANVQYEFQLVKSDAGKYRITSYSPIVAQTEQSNAWKETLDNGMGSTAGQLMRRPLSKLIDGSEGRLKSATIATVNDKSMVRLEFDRLYPRSKKPYAAWAVVDPSRHWAVMSFGQQYAAGSDEGTIEYRDDVKEIAFPKRYLAVRSDPLGNPVQRMALEFDAPQPSALKASDLQLEAFGLEVPKSGVQPQASPLPVRPDAPSVNSSAAPSQADRVPQNSSADELAVAPAGGSTTSVRQLLNVAAITAGILGCVFYVRYLRTRGKATTALTSPRTPGSK